MLEPPTPSVNTTNRARSVGTFYGVLAFGTAVDITAGWLLGQPGFSPHARIIFALLPIPANLVLVALIVRRIRQLDEFLRHVHLEAVAIAFLLTGVAVFIYGYLQQAHVVHPLNFGIVWIFMVVFYGVGYLIAARHYR
jgi:MFS family permease